MLGIQDTYVWAAYVLCILSTVLCIVYGLVNWNRGEEVAAAPDTRWAEEEKKIDDEV